MKKSVVAAVGAGVLLLGVVVRAELTPPRIAHNEPESFAYRYREDDSLEATGSLQDDDVMTLPSELGGTLVSFPVTAGERVRAGQVLARIDPSRYFDAVSEAEGNLVSAEGRYRELLDGATPQAVAVAEAGVAQARVNLKNAQAAYEKALSAREQTTAEAETALEAARTALRNQETLEEREIYSPGPDALKQSYADQLSQAREAYSEAEAKLAAVEAQGDLSVQQAKNGVEAAQAALQQAEANLNQVEAPARPSSLAQAEGAVKAAQAALALAEKNQSDAVITAPVSGVVLETMVQAGAKVMPGEPLLKLAGGDPSDLEIVVGVAEDQMGRVHIGEAARCSIPSLGKDHLSGRVAYINWQWHGSGQNVLYPVTIKLLHPTELAGAEPGMPVFATLLGS